MEGQARLQPRSMAWADVPSVAQFFLHAFKDQDVCIQRRARAEQEACNARQGECEVEPFEHSKGNRGIDQNGDDRHDAGHAVVDDHEQYHDQHADQTSHHALGKRVCAEGGTDDAGFHDLERNGQGAVAKLNGKCICGFVCEIAADSSLVRR